MDKKRNSAIELFRVFLMYLIVWGHAISQTELGSSEIVTTKWINILMASMARPATCAFMVMTAWLMNCNREWKSIKDKIICVWLKYMITCVFVSAISFIIWNESIENIIYSFFPVSWRPVWYISCYIMFLCFVPLLNIAIQNMTHDNRNALILSILPVYGIGTLTPVLFKYTRDFPAFYSELLCFIVIYIIVNVYREKIKKFKYWGGVFVVNTVILFIGKYYRVMYRDSERVIVKFVGYFYSHLETIVCLIYALSMLMMVNKFSYYNKWINKISKATMIVYIIHQMPMFYEHFWNDIWKLNNYVDKGPLRIEIQLITMALVLYMISVLINNIIDRGIVVLRTIFSKGFWRKRNGSS